MHVHNESEYEDLLSLWADLEAGLGIILSNPDSVQEFEQRVHQAVALVRGEFQVDSYQVAQHGADQRVRGAVAHRGI